MTTLREAAQQALGHVQEFKRRWMAVPLFGNKVNKATREAVSLAHMPVFQLEEALRAALEQPEQEPVAFYLPQDGEDDSLFRDARTVIACTGNKWLGWIPLYTHPPRREWRGLSKDESLKLWGMRSDGPSNTEITSFALAIEAALKEKNHG